MKDSNFRHFALLWLIALSTCSAADTIIPIDGKDKAILPVARAVTITEQIPFGEMEVEASSSLGHKIVPKNLIDGTGMDGKLWHDDDPHATTMWHTVDHPQATSPGPGMPVALAWIRVSFKAQKAPNRCVIWNHNQDALINRGFREAMAFVTVDGTRWKPVLVNGKATFEIPRASGALKEPASLVLTLPGGPISGFVLLAKNNYGSNVYGLSAIQFKSDRNVPLASLPEPTSVTAVNFPFTTQSNGDWQRQVMVSTGTSSIFEAVDATVECGGVAERTHFDADSTGQTSFTAKLPPRRNTKRNSSDTLKVTLASGRWSRTLDAQLTPCKWPNLEEVIVTWKTHMDIGFTHHPLKMMDWYRNGLMDQALRLIDNSAALPAFQRFAWMLPAWAMEMVLDNKQTPERRSRLEQAVRDGRLIWHGLPYTFEAEAMDAEEMARCLAYGVWNSQRFNSPLPRDAKLTDVPVQAWLVPTVLAHAGIEFLHVGCNSGSKAAKVPTLFWWEGPDGSRLLTGYADQYGWGPIPPEDWTHKTWLAMNVTNDNSGPPSAGQLQRQLNQIREQLPGVRVRYGRPSDFADAILKEHSEIPVVRKDMPDTWIHGMMSMPEASGIHRQATMLLPTLGILDTELAAWGIERPADVADLLQRGYEQSGLYAEHTWGPSGGRMPGGKVYDQAKFKQRMDEGLYLNWDAEFEFHANYARQAMALATGGLTPRMAALAREVAVKGPRVVVFNPLPWARSADASVELPDGAALPSGVRDERTRRVIPVSVEGRTVRFNAPEVPAGGYCTFACVAGDTRKPITNGSADTLETAHFKVKFDLQRGGIASLVEKATGRELVEGKTHALGQFLHQRFDHDEVKAFLKAYCRNWAVGGGDFGKNGMPGKETSPHWEATPGPWALSIVADALGERAVLTCSNTLGLAESYTATFKFPASRGCVDIGWEVKNKTPNPIPEGGWLCVPLAVDHPAFRVGEVGGSVDPAKDIVVGGNRKLLVADRAITVRAGESGAGAAVASTDLPLWSLGEPGLWKYSDDYVPTKPELFVNICNNMWDTNYPLWIGGSWKTSFRVWPVAQGATEEQAVFTPAWELRQGALAAYAEGAPGKMPVTQPGLALSRKGVRVTAFCPNPYGAGTLLRIWEQAGDGGNLVVTLPAGLKAAKAQPVNLRGERAGEAIVIKDGQFSISQGAWTPASFVIDSL